MTVTMCEVWLPAPGYEGAYEISDLGRVYAHERQVRMDRQGHLRIQHGGILKHHWRGAPGKEKLTVRLSREGKSKAWPVHRLVLTAFDGLSPPDKPFGCHGDDDPSNNRLDNLRWDDATGNLRDAYRNGGRMPVTHCPNGMSTPKRTRCGMSSTGPTCGYAASARTPAAEPTVVGSCQAD